VRVHACRCPEEQIKANVARLQALRKAGSADEQAHLRSVFKNPEHELSAGPACSRPAG
jgi:hypothetical protein